MKQRLLLLQGGIGGGGGIPEAPTDGQKYGRQSSGWAVINDGYIDGEVDVYSNLPVTVGDPVLLSAYLVKEAEGLWLINRKPAGVYVRTANAGALTDWTYAGAFPDVFNDANFELYDDGDSTKKLKFSLGGITTGNTRTLTAPDASGTIALIGDAIPAVTPGTSGNVLTSNGSAWTSAAPAAGGTKTYARFTPSDNYPPAANFATLDTRNSILVLDFDDGATNEEAVFVGMVPESASLGSGLKVRIYWMATSATSGNCRWGVQFADLSDQDIDGLTFDTAAEAHTATSGTSGIAVVTEITITDIDDIVAGVPFALKVYRDSSDTTNDTMSGDAELVAVEIRSAA